MLSPVCLFSSLSSFSVLLCIYTLLYLLNLFMYMYVILHNCMCLRHSDITVLAVNILSNVSLMLSLVCLFFFFFLCIPLHLHPCFTSLIYLCTCRFIYREKKSLKKKKVHDAKPFREWWVFRRLRNAAKESVSQIICGRAFQSLGAELEKKISGMNDTLKRLALLPV